MANHRAPKRSASRTGTTDGVELTAAAAAPPVSGPGKRKAVKPSRGARTLPRRTQTTPPRPVVEATPSAPSPSTHTELRAAAPSPADSRTAGPPALAAAETSAAAASPAGTRATAPSGARVAARSGGRSSAPSGARIATRSGSRAATPADTRASATPGTRAVTSSGGARTATPSGTRIAARSGGDAGRKNPFPLLPSAPTAVGAAALVIAATGAVTFTHSTEDIAAASSTKVYTPASALTGTSAATSSLELDSRSQAVSRDSERAALKDAADEKLQKAVEAQAEERNAALAQLAASAEKYAGEIAANAWHLPVASYHLTAGFGESSGLWANTHTGLDFAAPTGTPVVSVANGTVRSADYSGAYGNRIVIGLEDGTEIWYCHLSAFNASVGEEVAGGDQIGLVGATGNVTGPHLHLEVRPGAGDPVDPMAALIAHGLQP